MMLDVRYLRFWQLFHKRGVRWFMAAHLAFAFVLVGFVLSYRGVVKHRGQQRLTTILAQLDATDPAWHWDDIERSRPRVPAAENSMVLMTDFVAAWDQSAAAHRKQRGFSWRFELEPNRQLNADAQEEIAAELEAKRPALVVALRFKDFPHGTAELARDRAGLMQLHVREDHFENLIDLLDMAAERHGINPGASDVPRQMLNVERALESAPLLEAQRARTSYTRRVVQRVERLLAQGEPHELHGLQADLLSAADSDRFWSMLRGERAAMHQFYVALTQGQVALPNVRDSNLGVGYYWGNYRTRLDELGFLEWMYAPRLPDDHAAMLEFTTAFWCWRDRPVAEFLATDTTHLLVYPPIPPRRQRFAHDVASMLAGQFLRAHDTTAYLRCASVAIAVERYRQHFGYWPRSLKAIPPSLLPTIPLDPYDGQPLKYAPTVDGIVVYSVGRDLTDQHGADGHGRRYDLGVRLYNLDHRALPAPPKPLDVNGYRRADIVEVGPLPREVQP